MFSDNIKEYLIFCVTDKAYLENTYVTLHSFFKYNDYKVTVFTPDFENFQEIKDRLKEFNVSVEFINIDVEMEHFFYKHLKPVIAKLKIFDNSKYKYNLCFDTDTLFLGSIKDVIKDYNSSLIGVKERLKKDINVGFCIYKKSNLKLFEKFKEYSEKYGYFYCPEQDFLNFIIEDKEYLDTKYNICYWTNDSKEKIMIHYASKFKPFNFKIPKEFTTDVIFQLRLFKHYFDFIKDLNINKEVKDKIEKAKRFYEKCSLFYNLD